MNVTLTESALSTLREVYSKTNIVDLEASFDEVKCRLTLPLHQLEEHT